MHDSNANVDRLYILRTRGREMIQIELSYKTSTIGQYKCYSNNNNRLDVTATSHKNSSLYK